LLKRYGKGINFYQFVEHSLNAVFIMGKEGIVYSNQKLIDLLGINSMEELLGKSFYKYIHPDYHQVCKEI
jgi:two-component system sporulation sensor kinase A